MEIVVYHKCERNDRLLPTPLRCLIVGSSGSGKTNLLLNLIYNKNGLEFKHLYIFSRSIQQDAYVELKQNFANVEKKLKRKIAYLFSTCDDLIPLDECEPNSLIVFDDCLLEGQTKIKDYFIRGRHKNLSCIYLTQSYSRVDMQVIRNNVNMLCVFKQNKHYTKRIYDDFVGSDMTFQEFERTCAHCWNIPYGFITVNMTRTSKNGKYRCLLGRLLNSDRTSSC